MNGLLRVAELYGIVIIATLSAVGLDAQTSIRFTTLPYDTSSAEAAHAVAGVAYAYDAEAVASNGGAVRYSLRYGPAGMQVDQNSGLVTWTPQVPGTYLVEIRASLAADPSIATGQNWAILATTCASGAVIAGRVTDALGVPISEGTVVARILGFATTPRAVVSGPIVNGAYRLAVDSGRYVVRAEGDFVTKWYDDAATFAAATPVDVGCGDSVTADFAVQVIEERGGAVTVSGRVIDVRTNTPVKGMLVGYLMVPKWKWYGADEQWLLRANAEGHVDYQATGDDGVFSESVFDESDILFASVRDDGSEPNTHGWLRQFYSYTPNRHDARPIVPEGPGEIRDINFLIDGTKPNQLIVALMLDTAGRQMYGQIVLYALKRTPSGFVIDPSHSAATENGHPQFWAAAQKPGEYVVLGIPSDTNYAPGFYVEDDTSAIDWLDATIVTLDSTTPGRIDLDMWMRARDAQTGRSQLRGSVAGVFETAKDGEPSLHGAEPLGGTLVVATDSLDRIGAFTYSNDDGSYLLRGLAAGTWSVIATKPDFDASRRTEVVSGHGEIIRSDHVLAALQPSGVTITRDRPALPMTLHPNPAKSRAQLSVTVGTGALRVTIATIDGRAVREIDVDAHAPTTELDLDVSTLPAGSYLITASSIHGTATTSMTITR